MDKQNLGLNLPALLKQDNQLNYLHYSKEENSNLQLEHYLHYKNTAYYFEWLYNQYFLQNNNQNHSLCDYSNNNLLKKHRLLILARHGAVCWGEDMEEAYLGIERLEHMAQILKSAMELGGISSMEMAELEALRSIREKMGPRIL